MRRWRTRVVTGVVIGAVALGLVAPACGRTTSVSSGPSTTPPGSGEPDVALAAVVSRAGERSCTDVSSGRLDMTIDVRGESTRSTGTVTLTMVFDRDADRASFSMDLSGLLGGGDDGSGIPSGGGSGLEDLVGVRPEVVLDGDTAYVNWPFINAFLGVDTKWAKLTGGARKESPAPLGADGCEPLQLLEGVGADVTEVGAETIDGVPTTHYRAVVDVEKALAEATGEERRKLEEFVDNFPGTRQFPVDLWVGDDGIVRKMTFTVEGYDVSSLSEGGGRRSGRDRSGATESGGSATFTLSFTDINRSVEIELPPDDEVSEPAFGAGSRGDSSGSADGGFGGGFGDGFGGTDDGRDGGFGD